MKITETFLDIRRKAVIHWLALIVPVIVIAIVDPFLLYYVVVATLITGVYLLICKFALKGTSVLDFRKGGMSLDDMVKFMKSEDLPLTNRRFLLTQINQKECQQLQGRNILEASIRIGIALVMATVGAVLIIFGK